MRKKVIGYNRTPKEVADQLKKDFDFTYFEDIDPKSDPAFLTALKEAHGIINLALKVDKELLGQAPNLEIVSNISTGYSNFDLDEMTKRNVMATNTPGVLEETTADAIFGILIAAARRISELDAFVKQGQWTGMLKEDSYGTDVHHKTLGMIGMGKIGGEIAKRAHFGFDMEILYHNRSRNAETEQKYQARYCDLVTLLKESDFVCLMTPLTAETKHLMGKREFQLMKPSAIFINGSRGQTVDEKALIHALEKKEILAAGLDVYQSEPLPADHPFLKMKNVVTTPHIGSSTAETELKMAQLAAENLIKGLKGECPPNLVNQAVWKRS